ncbi:unnamed protein product [Scytosiphon promiscuus]
MKVAMTWLVSSLVGALPRAQAFVGVNFGRSLSRRTFAAGTATATTTTFSRRSPHALGRGWGVGAAIATPRPSETAVTSRREGLTGGRFPVSPSSSSTSPLRTFASTGGTMEAAATDSGGTKHVLVPVADGSEEIESVTIIDTLVRAGAAVTVASVGSDVEVTCSRGVKIKADCKIAECETREWDAVVCPGGMPGAVNLKENKTLEGILKRQDSNGRIIAAICAAPAVVLASHGLLAGKEATCYPASVFTAKIPQLVDKNVVVDGNLITSQGPATSMAFALQLVDSLFGQAKAEEIAQGMLFK